MRIIKRAAVLEYGRTYPQARVPLRQWLQVTRAAEWSSIQDVRRIFPHADAVTVASGNTVTVFNIGGNDFRLVVSIKYKWGVVYVREFMTHREYSRDAWKDRH